MSSYLNLYLIPKKYDKDKKELKVQNVADNSYLLFSSFCRGTAIYTVFQAELNIPSYVYNEKTKEFDAKYHFLDKANLDIVMNALNKNLKRVSANYTDYVKYKSAFEHALETLTNTKVEKDVKDTIKKLEDILNVRSDYDYTEEYKEDIEDIEFAIDTVKTMQNLIDLFEYSDFYPVIAATID